MLCCRQWSWADSSVAFVKNTCSEIPIAYSMMASFKKTKYEKKSSLIHHILTSPSDMPLCWLCWDISHVSSPCSLQSHVWGSSDVSLPFYLFLKGVKHPSFFTYFFSFLKNCHKYLFPIHALYLRHRVASHISVPSLSAVLELEWCTLVMWVKNSHPLKGSIFNHALNQTKSKLKLGNSWRKLWELNAQNSRCCEAANKLTAQFFKSCPGNPVSLLHG